MPLIQLDFENKLNTSVQTGDVAYFSNPIDYGTAGNSLNNGDQWSSTTTPHLTSNQSDIIKIGVIETIIPWDGEVNSIICDMPQNLFNQYFSEINKNIVCTPSANDTGSNCFDKISVSYSDLLSNVGNFVDPLAQYGYTGSGWPANYNGPKIYGYTGGPHLTPFRSEMNQLILHWMWNNNQSANVSDFIFEDFDGNFIIVNAFIHQAYVPGVSSPQQGPVLTSSNQPALNTGGFLYSVNEIINLWQTEYNNHNATSLSYTGFGGWSTSTIFPVSTLGAVGAFNATKIVPGCSFDDFYNRQIASGVGFARRTFAFSEPCTSVVDPTVTCTGQGSFIMFSKDNKVNLSSALGYYASVTFKNNSTEKAELFNVGADVFESSK